MKTNNMHYYVDALKKYAVFKGRATRKEFWMFFLWTLFVSIVLGIIATVVVTATGRQAIALIPWLYAFAIFLPSLALSVRRLHDVGKSGWLAFGQVYLLIASVWQVLLLLWPAAMLSWLLSFSLSSAGMAWASVSFIIDLVVFVDMIALLIFFLRGSAPDNKYGPNPKGSPVVPVSASA